MTNMINSNNIQVFPSVRRGVVQPSSRLMSEEAFTAIVNRFVEYDSFVIKYPQNPDGSLDRQGSISFNIHGYYFKVATVEDLLQDSGTKSGSTLKVFIEVVKVGDYYEIWGQDVDNMYQGLKIAYNDGEVKPEHGGVVYSLDLFQRSTPTGNDWDIVYNSLFRFTSNTVKFEIDGGRY